MLPILKSLAKGEPVSAISLRQPWAMSVAWLAKDIENRSNWPFKYRGPILIHAAAAELYMSDLSDALDCAAAGGLDEKSRKYIMPDEDHYRQGLMPRGYIVAVANLADVFGPERRMPRRHPAAKSPWADPNSKYHLYFDDSVRVEPVKLKGRVGLFKIPYSVAASLVELDTK